MFDIAWSEMVLVGAVALVVIGPKDLPRALRTLGQTVGKVRRMASEFQTQFNDAMREAELDDLKKQVENVGDQVKAATEFDPIGQIHDDFGTPKPDAAAAPDAETTATLAALPAPEMPPPVEIPAAPVATPAAEPKPSRKRKAAADKTAVEPSPAGPAPVATTEKPRRVRTAKTAAPAAGNAAVPARPPKPPRKRKPTTVEPGEGSPA